MSASKASRQDAGEFVSAWVTLAAGVIESAARAAKRESVEDIVDEERRDGRCLKDESAYDSINLRAVIRFVPNLQRHTTVRESPWIRRTAC